MLLPNTLPPPPATTLPTEANIAVLPPIGWWIPVGGVAFSTS
jgi:hypothetical protein